MGVYLSSPVTEKESVDGQCERFVYGASSMQGWRTAQEDAHNCIPLFDEKTKTSFFAVYDGHGGPEVAKYCEKYFPGFVKKLMDKQGDTEDSAGFIKNAFLEFDATLTTEDVIKELKELAGSGDDNEEDEDDDPVGRSETELLKEEANMPLDQLLAQYKNTPSEEAKNSQEKLSSIEDLKSDKESTSNVGSSNLDQQNGSSSSVPITPSSSSSLSSTQNISPQISNGEKCLLKCNENDNAQTPKTVNIVDNQLTSNCLNSNDKTTSSTTHNHLSSTVTGEPLSPPSPSTTELEAENHCSSKVSKSADSNIQNSTSSLDSAQAGGSTSRKTASLDVNNEPSVSGTSSSSGIRSSKAKAAIETAKLDGDMDSSDEDEDEEDVWEDMSDDEDDDDDEEQDDEQDEDVPMMDHSDEEPGSDSGCTACVVLMQGKKLIVANAGDSRCVLSRAGKAVDLSFDHKPEDDSEKDRIENAGGKVTADGRVNGGLNLSRAIGDHVYKRNEDLPAEEQMITALPDVETEEICDEDNFIVIACDGIWNYMSSQEVVDFVSERLKDTEMRQKPSAICEELFDHCLAPNTSGDGTGCDNMTCIIIILNTSKAEPILAVTSTENISQQQVSNVDESGNAGLANLKRAPDNLEASKEKRLKVE